MTPDEEAFRPRRADDGDIDAIASIWREGWIAGHSGHVPAALEDARLSGSWTESATSRLGSTWVCCDAAGEVLGFVTVVGNEIEQVYVATRARGSGVAVALLRHGEEVVRSGGADRAWLAVVAGNDRARHFYEREGWSDVGTIDYTATTTAGPVIVAAHRYERALPEDNSTPGFG